MRSLTFLLLVGLAAAYKSYEGYHVIDVVPEHVSQVRYLHDLLLNDIHIDFWEEPSKVGKKVRMMMSQEYLQTFSKQLAYHRLAYTVFNDNVERTVQAERDEIAARRAQRGNVFDIDDFNTLDDINGWLADQNSGCPAAGLTCTLSSLGTSYEGRDINLFTVTANPGSPIIYIDSTTHAREWLTPATTLKIINHLLTGYGSDNEVTDLLTSREWHFVTIENPDGYEYSWTNDRYQRKNRAPNDGSGCIGTDLNRNFDYKWSQNGVSFNPCSDTYCGDSGGSELETQAIQNHLNSIGSRTYAVITLHSYGYDWMHPWGTTTSPGNDNAPCDIADDHDDMFAAAEAAGRALEATGGSNWDWGNSCVVIYTTSGATDDYSKGGAGIKYAFNPELRGFDFVISAGNIQPSFEEVWAATVAQDAVIAGNPPF